MNLVAQFLIWHPGGTLSCPRQLSLYQRPFSILFGYPSKMPQVGVYLEEKCLGIFSVLAEKLESSPGNSLPWWGPFPPSLQMRYTAESTATLSKHRLCPEITKRVPGQKVEVVSWCAHCVAGHKDPTECSTKAAANSPCWGWNLKH